MKADLFLVPSAELPDLLHEAQGAQLHSLVLSNDSRLAAVAVEHKESNGEEVPAAAPTEGQAPASAPKPKTPARVGGRFVKKGATS